MYNAIKHLYANWTVLKPGKMVILLPWMMNLVPHCLFADFWNTTRPVRMDQGLWYQSWMWPRILSHHFDVCTLHLVLFIIQTNKDTTYIY